MKEKNTLIIVAVVRKLSMSCNFLATHVAQFAANGSLTRPQSIFLGGSGRLKLDKKSTSLFFIITFKLIVVRSV